MIAASEVDMDQRVLEAPFKTATPNARFDRLVLPRSGARPKTLHAAIIWSGATETTLSDDAVIRHEARLLLERDGGVMLHLLGAREEDGEMTAWHAVLADADERTAFEDAAHAYDPARLTTALDAAACGWEADCTPTWRRFAEESDAIKRDLLALLGELSGLDLSRRSVHLN